MATPSTPSTSTTTTGATAASTTVASPTDVETVTHIQMAGLTVLMVRKKDQVIYKLPDNMSVQSLSQDQRERLLAEINLLHHQQTTAQALAATQAQTHQVHMAQAQAQAQANGQGVRPIAPSAQSTQTNGVQEQTATTVGMSHNAPSSSTPVSYSSNSSATTTSADGQQKTTRRYNKTGKYSKKKLMQQQILEAQGIRSTTEPYLRPQDSRMKSLQPPQQPLAINSIGLRTYAAAAASPIQTSLQQTGTSATTTAAASIPVHTTLQSAFLQQLLQQQQQQQQQVLALSNLDQTRQFQLLQEIHQLQQQIEVQQTTTNTFRERELTVQRVLAHHKPVDARTQQLVQQNLVEAEKSLERIKKQLREKEAVFREQFPVFSQQLLVLQHQQQLQLQQRQTAAAAGGLARTPLLTTGSTPASVSHPTSIAAGPSDLPKTVEAELQQRIKGHHDSVRNAMAVELQAAHRAVTLPDWRTPFSSLQDAIERLLPFHVFQYPAQDLESHAKAFDSRPEVELDTRALLIHRRKHDLFNKYNKLLKDSATKATTTNPSSALDIIALRYSVEDEQAEYRKVLAERDVVQAQAQMLKHELELRQQQLLQQRRTEAVLIEQQQKLMLERQRLEELEQQEQEKRQRQLEDQIRQLQALQQQHRLGEVHEMQLHMQQQQQQHQLQQQQQGLLLKRTEEEEEQERKKEELRRMHQLELEKQLRIKQESLQKEQEEAARAQELGATTGSTSISSISSTTPSTSTPSISSSSPSTTASVLPPNAPTS
ncbi:hypothetical protein BG011_002504 [Mortierella polycephala]|uniref:GLTSCR protein conserved domain-containing protein n=1 Tax=Mortierella polycephala TaxID=41804 RepID=A0A9P6U428_9FUNG|nr:hypothetical protein BG011_002504 [Mortierella polycephala]